MFKNTLDIVCFLHFNCIVLLKKYTIMPLKKKSVGTKKEKKPEIINTFYSEIEPEYVKVYLTNICYLFKIANSQMKVLFYYLKELDYDNKFYNNRYDSDKAVKDLKISKSCLDKNLKKLCNSGFFNRISRGVYRANPKIFARGAWSRIKSLIQEVNELEKEKAKQENGAEKKIDAFEAESN